MPFPRVVEAIAPARSSSHTPLYQTLFSIADAPLPDLDAAGLAIVPGREPRERLGEGRDQRRGRQSRRPRRGAHRADDHLGVQQRPVLGRDRRAHGAGTTARCWSRSSPSPPAAPRRSRCSRTMSGSVCWSSGTTPPPTIRATSTIARVFGEVARPGSGRDRGDDGERLAHLRRARPPLEPARPPPPRPRRRVPARESASRPSARSRWWWRCSASSRRAAPTCRSTPATPTERRALRHARRGDLARARSGSSSRDPAIARRDATSRSTARASRPPTRPT